MYIVHGLFEIITRVRQCSLISQLYGSPDLYFHTFRFFIIKDLNYRIPIVDWLVIWQSSGLSGGPNHTIQIYEEKIIYFFLKKKYLQCKVFCILCFYSCFNVFECSLQMLKIFLRAIIVNDSSMTSIVKKFSSFFL